MGEPQRIEVVHESPCDELGNPCQFQAIALPFFCALDALAINDGSGRARRATGLFPASLVQSMVDPIQRAIPLPALKITKQRAARRKVLWNGPPLAPSTENIKQTINKTAFIHMAPVTAALRPRDQRRKHRGLVAYLCRSGCSFRLPGVRRPGGFCLPKLNAFGAGYRSR